MGQVNVYFGKDPGNNYPYPDFASQTRKILYGNKRDSGLFGYTLNTEGDLNSDGVRDLIVGAPYENDGEGAIYIFNGGSDFFDTFSQVDLLGFVIICCKMSRFLH